MINRQLLHPESIVVIGGSNNVHKPGGAIVRNIINGGYKGVLRIVNPKEDEVQGVKAFHDISELPPTDLAILVIPSHMCPETVDRLAEDKGVKAFIIISAGFGEETKEGAKLEQHILDTCERHGAALIGPNCIGLLNSWHHSVFTKPIPTLHEKGVDFISGSGATAVFILESAVTKGLPFNSVWSIGNGKQIVLAADRTPAQLGMGKDGFDERITSRLSSGFTTPIQVPSYELKLRLIETFCERMREDALRENVAGLAGTVPPEAVS